MSAWFFQRGHTIWWAKISKVFLNINANLKASCTWRNLRLSCLKWHPFSFVLKCLNLKKPNSVPISGDCKLHSQPRKHPATWDFLISPQKGYSWQCPVTTEMSSTRFNAKTAATQGSMSYATEVCKIRGQSVNTRTWFLNMQYRSRAREWKVRGKGTFKTLGSKFLH